MIANGISSSKNAAIEDAAEKAMKNLSVKHYYRVLYGNTGRWRDGAIGYMWGELEGEGSEVNSGILAFQQQSTGRSSSTTNGDLSTVDGTSGPALIVESSVS